MTASSPTRRRWFHYRLRTLLIVVAVLAIPLAWIAKERRQSALEVQFVQRVLTHRVGGPFDSWNLILEGKPQGWWRNLSRRLMGTRIIELVFQPGEFDDMAPLADFTNLQALSVNNTNIRNLDVLPKLRSLRFLDLNDTQLSDLTLVGGLMDLQVLELSSTPVADLSPLIRLKQLDQLTLSNTRVTDVTPLAALPKLRILDLTGTSVRREQIESLQQSLPNCTMVHDPFP